jgi:hypothetical protein
MIFIILLILFSIYGAFIGAERAQSFFNALPLTVYWVAFIILLILGIGLFRRLLRTPGLLLVHLGCICVFACGMWSSQGGHQIQKRYFGIDKIRAGQIVIYEEMKEERVIPDWAKHVTFGLNQDGKPVIYGTGSGSNSVLQNDDKRIFSLPFQIKLKDFRMDYYDPTRLFVRAMDGRLWKLEPIEVGARFDLGDEATLTILEIFKNFKLKKSGKEFIVYDYKGPGSNPVLRVLVKHADGTQEEQFAFSFSSGHMSRNKRFLMQYQTEGMVKDYFSDVQVIDHGKAILEKTIQVNDPLYYGGYHFYQHSYDTQNGQFTVLMVTSNSGLYGVYAGYWLIMLGIIWHMWISRVPKRTKARTKTEGGHHGA